MEPTKWALVWKSVRLVLGSLAFFSHPCIMKCWTRLCLHHHQQKWSILCAMWWLFTFPSKHPILRPIIHSLRCTLNRESGQFWWNTIWLTSSVLISICYCWFCPFASHTIFNQPSNTCKEQPLRHFSNTDHMHLLFAVQRPLFSFGFSLPFQRGHHVQKYLLICFANTTHMREFFRINEPMFQLHVTTQSQFSPFSAKSHIVCFDFSFTSPQKWWYKSKLRPISIYCI